MDVVIHGKTGLLVPFKGNGCSKLCEGNERKQVDIAALTETLITLLRNAELAAALGRAGRRRAFESFGLEQMVNGTLLAYQSVRAASGLRSCDLRCKAKVCSRRRSWIVPARILRSCW